MLVQNVIGGLAALGLIVYPGLALGRSTRSLVRLFPQVETVQRCLRKPAGSSTCSSPHPAGEFLDALDTSFLNGAAATKCLLH